MVKANVTFWLTDGQNSVTLTLQANTVDALKILVAECVTGGFWYNNSTPFLTFYSPNCISSADVVFI